MPPLLNLPVSLLSVLMTVRPCFTAPAFTTFCGLVAGLAGQVRRRTVVGMLLGACLQRAWPHDRAHYFFSRARWQLDELGLAVARLVVDALIDPGADVTVALDDSVCVRTGPKVHGTGWQHDGSAKNPQKLSFGNCFVTVGIVVALPFCSRAWCLPVLARLHLPGKGAGPSKTAVAAELAALLAAAFPGRRLHVVADAAYHGPALRALPENVTWTCRLPRTAVLYGLAPPRTGKRGRPRTKGERLGTPADLARNAAWTTHHVVTYHGRTDIKHTATIRCLWYGSFHARTVTVVLVRDQDTTSGYDLALVTTDGTASTPAATTSPGTAKRPSRPSRTCSSSSAAPSSRPDFPLPSQASPPTTESAPSPQPGPQQRPNPQDLRKSRFLIGAEELGDVAGHDRDVERGVRQHRRGALDPGHLVGAGLGAGRVQRRAGRVDPGDRVAGGGHGQRQPPGSAAEVEHPRGGRLTGHAEGKVVVADHPNAAS